MIRATHSRAGRLPALLFATLAAAALVVACGDDGEGTTDALPIYEVTVTADALEPAALELRVPEKAQVVVRNESDRACSFQFGPYVDGLMVPAEDDATIAFTATDVTGTAPAEQARLDMGCDDGRMGEIVLLTSTAQ